MKKLALLTMLFFASFLLVACGDSEDYQADVDDAIARLPVSGLGDTTSDFWLPLDGRHETRISWESDQPDYLRVTEETRERVLEEDADGNPVRVQEQVKLEVNRPEIGEENVNFTLTATVTKGDASATREYYGTVLAEDPADEYETYAALHATASINDLVQVTGIIVARMPVNLYIYDGEHILSIYGPNMDDYELGQKIEVIGQYRLWQTLWQISSVERVRVLEEGLEYDVEDIMIESSVEEINAMVLSKGENPEAPLKHGMPYLVTGYIEDHPDDNWIFRSADSDERLIFTFNQSPESDDILEDYEGQLVELTVHINARITDGVLIFIDKDNYVLNVLEED